MEIGSEFEKVVLKPLECGKKSAYEHLNELFEKDSKYLVSGRAAIKCAITDIVEKRNVKKAYLPSYICESVVKPFEESGIEIEYYEVSYTNGFNICIDLNKECDIFFAMNYFGYSQNNMDKYIQEFKKREVIVIEDITHSLLLKQPYSKLSDYVVASIRKWFPVASGGFIAKTNGAFNCEQDILSSDEIVAVRIEAMENKSEYLKRRKDPKLKEKYLCQYGEFNQLLKDIAYQYDMDEYSFNVLKSVDINEVISARKTNALRLHSNLRNVNGIKFVFDINDESVPIFVPILVENNKRDKLRKYMTENQIYLPCHWPKIKSGDSNKMYNDEISIVVDQRYGVEHMDRICEKILTFFEKEREK